MADKKNLLLLFERPLEPVFMTKGNNNTVFDVPGSFYNDRYQPIGTELSTRFGGEAENKITVKQISQPNLTIPMSLGRHEPFSLFIPRHRKIAARMIDIFMGVRSIDDLQSVACYARDRVNPFLFNYAFSVALLHRPDTKDLNIPLYTESFPDKFIDSKVLNQIREEATVVTDQGSRRPIIIPKDYTASDLDEEHRLWYFREDMGVNLHHWHWHLVYPFSATNRAIVEKDRRGELFYYMHEQIIARYNAERFSNRMNRVKRLNNLREPIAEGYFPKMDSLVASRAWAARAANTKLSDLNREVDQVKQDISDMERWSNLFITAIHEGAVVDASNNRIPLTEANGINILGNMMESSILSPNQQLYGDLHNFGHVFISYSHDPDHRHLESFGVIGASETAMRDPAFYRWHAYIDDIFQEYKELLPPYTQPSLTFTGVTISGIQVQPEGGQANTLQTYWQQSDLNLSRGMDFIPRGNVYARFTHLQHIPFTYTIHANNSSGAQRQGTVRIFIGPKNDERGTSMLFRDQRLLMIELDKFTVQLNAGQNTIQRRSTESSVTIPFERTFRNVDDNRPADGTTALEEFNFCGCGWPHHMLIPKGLTEGLVFQLFVMITNFEDDRIDQDLVGSCNDASSYCGIRDRMYPDRKPMGYPFDRLPRTGSDTLPSFLTPNMNVQEVRIIHSDTTRLRTP